MTSDGTPLPPAAPAGTAVPRRTVERRLDDHTACLLAAAERRGMETEQVLRPYPSGTRPRRWLRLRVNGTPYYYRSGVLRRAAARDPNQVGYHINGRGVTVTSDKAQTKAMIAAAGIPVPEGRVFPRSALAEAIAYGASLGGPVCVKPNTGGMGNLVFPNRKDPAKVAAAFSRASERYEQILVERSVPGEAIRYFFVDPSAVAVKASLPPQVEGDGRRCILDLIDEKNTRGWQQRPTGYQPILVDSGLEESLADQGLSLATVPGASERVILRPISNGHFGGESVACFEAVHGSYARQATLACQAIPGVKIAAVDLMVVDLSSPAAPENHWVLEINSSPGLTAFEYPSAGPPQRVSEAVLDLLFRLSGPT